MHICMYIWSSKHINKIIKSSSMPILHCLIHFLFCLTPLSPPTSPFLITSLPSHGNNLGGILSHFFHVHIVIHKYVIYIYTHTYAVS